MHASESVSLAQRTSSTLIKCTISGVGPNSKLVDENTMDCASAQGLPKPQVYSDVLLL